jgi:hypothetical protein
LKKKGKIKKEMDFITKQQRQFQKLVTNYFVTTYNLVPKYISNARTPSLQENNLYIYKNNILVNNKVIKIHFNTRNEVNNKNYTMLSILYKNVYYKRINGSNYCELNSSIKENISKDKKRLDLKYKNLEKDTIVIGRKYKTRENDIFINCVGLQCILKKDGIPIKQRQKKEKKELDTQIKIQLSKEQKQEFQKHIHENRVYLDLEYINDIYDDFSLFPISKNNSMIFMIGLVDKNSNYINYTTDNLNQECENEILKRYITYIKENTKNGKDLYIYHWSGADYTGIMNGLKRHTQLYNEYKQYEKQVRYIDLLKITKEIVKLDSYSLKYVSKVLLNKKYTTDCQNGFDAMTVIIQKNSELQEKESLMIFDETKDIIKYNQMDTELLNELTNWFLN